jgi:hypothetical protein
MQHGNKKYNFEALQSPGDTITVKPANIYSLKNSMRIFFKPADAIKFRIADHFVIDEMKGGNVQITRK